MANKVEEMIAYPNRIFWQKEDTNYKIIKFIVISGIYSGQAIVFKGKFDIDITNHDMHQKTKFKLTGNKEERKNKYNTTTFYLKSIQRGLNVNKIANQSIEWGMFFLKQVGLSKTMIKDLLSKLQLQDNNDPFISQIKKFNSAPFTLKVLFKLDKNQLAQVLPLLKGVGQNNVNNYIDKIANIDDSARKYATLSLELYKRGYNFTDAKKDLLFDQYQHVKTILKIIDNNFYDLTNANGLQIATVDELYLSNKNNHIYDVSRICSIIINTLKQGFQRHISWFTQYELLTYIYDQTQQKNDDDSTNTQQIVQENTKIALKQLIQEHKVVMVLVNGQSDVRIILHSIFNFERNIYGELSDLSKDNEVPNKFNPKIINEGIKEAEKQQGFEFTDEQIKVIKETLTHNIVSINGYAGTGKSSIVRALDLIFAKSGLSVTQVAFTGRAADSLSKSSNMPAQTAHAALSIVTDKDINNIFNNVSTVNDQFRDNIDKKFSKSHLPANSFPKFPDVYANVIIIDEYSTLSIILFAGLLSSALNNHQKLIVIGDSGQLPAIQYSSDQAINNSPFIKHYNLSAIKRQHNDSKIIEHSLEVRQGKIPDDINKRGLTAECGFKDIQYQFVNNFIKLDSLIKITMGAYQKLINLGDKVEDILLLSPINSFNRQINLEIQNKYVDHSKPSFMIGENNDLKVYQGEMIINNHNQTVNDKEEHKFRIYNGNVGKIINIYQQDGVKLMDVDFGPIGIANFVEGKETKTLDLAYAITTHKAQGSTAKDVIGVFHTYIPDTKEKIKSVGEKDLSENSIISKLYSRQMLYTMMTRSSDRLILITDGNTFKYGIDNNLIVNNRNDFDLINDTSKIKNIFGN